MGEEDGDDTKDAADDTGDKKADDTKDKKEEDKEEEKQEEEKKQEDDKKEDDKKEDDKKDDKKDEDKKDDDKKDDDKKDAASTEDDATPAKPKTKKRIHRVQLKVVPVVSAAQSTRRMTGKDAKVASKRLRDMEAADELRQKRDAEKNSLESFVFELRGQVRDNEDELAKVSPDDEREKIME